ncbi:hypothetical protein U1Q18_008506 [Sarracenia purpurea var. burkii]
MARCCEESISGCSGSSDSEAGFRIVGENRQKGLGGTAQVQVRVRDGRRMSVDGSKATVSVVVASRGSSCGAWW